MQFVYIQVIDHLYPRKTSQWQKITLPEMNCGFNETNCPYKVNKKHHKDKAFLYHMY